MTDTIFGYKFKNPKLLDEALTTPSFKMTSPFARDNQRLEFLGDAVLGLLAANRLYAEFPHEEEGPLTVRRTHLVSSPALCDAANRHSLAPLLKRNRGANTPIAPNAKLLADAIEAIIGAAWLDGGLDAAKQIFDFLAIESKAESSKWSGNPKGDLQIKAQAMNPPRLPVYRIIETRGSAHNPIFKVEVSVEGLGTAVASAETRREAESAAAAKLLGSAK